jgi:hypothetical protein
LAVYVCAMNEWLVIPPDRPTPRPVRLCLILGLTALVLILAP